MTNKSVLTWNSFFYWIGLFGRKKYPHTVEFPNISLLKYFAIKEWNNENLRRKWLLMDYCTMAFKDEEDAVAFKLRWI